MSDFTVRIATHKGGLRDDVEDYYVNRGEFARVAGQEYISAGGHTYRQADRTENTVTFMSIHPLRISLAKPQPVAQITEVKSDA